MQRWKLIIEYDGTDFHGWQVQPDGVPSVQSRLMQAIRAFCGRDITLTAAGRTDAGVHAHGQVVHFDLDYGDRALSGFDLAKAINAHLRPDPVAVVEAAPVSPDFHARFDAVNKLYRYRIVTRGAPPVMDSRYVWHSKHPLDLAAMREAAGHLLGRHDFTSFRDTQCQARHAVRTLDRLDISQRAYDATGGMEIVFELEAQSFLHHQCRNIIGTLALVGRGKLPPASVADILAARDRTKAGPTAPAAGLSLVRVDY